MHPSLRTSAVTAWTLAVLVGCLGATPLRAAQEGGKEPSDKDVLQGTWVVVSAMVAGENLPDEVAKTIKMIIKGDKATVEILGETKAGSYTIDPAKKPKTVDLNTEGMNLKGIYAFDGKNLKMCVCDGERPTEFKSEANTQNILVTFKRAEEPKKEKSKEQARLQSSYFTSTLVAQENKTDKDLIQGTWTMESGEKGGEKAPDEIVKGLKITFDGDKIIVSLMDKTMEGAFTLDPTKKPKTMDFNVGPEKIQAIYELSGNTLRICGTDAKEGRPGEFKSGAGSKTVLMLLKREKAKNSRQDAIQRALDFVALLQNDDKGKSDNDKLQGAWQAHSAELAGEKIPEEFVKGVKLIIKGDKVSASFMGEAKDGSYKIDPTQKPKTLDLTVDNKKIEAIYELDGDTLKVCASEEGRPKEFKSAAGSQSILLILKRVKDEKKANDFKDSKDSNEEARRRALDNERIRLTSAAWVSAQDTKAKDEKAKDTKGDKGKEQPKAKEKTKEKGDLGALQGVWRMVSMEAGGMKIPLEDLPGGSFRLIVAGDKISVITGGEEREEEGTLKLDEKAKPKHIDMAMKREQKTLEGIYKIDGNTLTICGGEPGRAQRPADFNSQDKNIFLIVLERTQAEKNGKPTQEKLDKVELAKAMRLSTHNLKQIGVAIHNYHDTFNQFPLPAIHSKDGKPLLSWRVAILPFIEQVDLYKEFKLDEPWDSEHNKKLLAKMPTIYAPVVGKHASGTTFYQVFNGPGALFEGNIKLKITGVKDGTANTVMVTEAGAAVPWTKPEDIPFDPQAKELPKLGGLFPDGFYVLMCDASVHFVSKRFDTTIFRAAVTRAGGEAIDLEKLSLPETKKKTDKNDENK
jgi:uncharacterized protein (TIGR03067 family)